MHKEIKFGDIDVQVVRNSSEFVTNESDRQLCEYTSCREIRTNFVRISYQVHANLSEICPFFILFYRFFA